mmetsp:Transcript_22896/g.52452  ORF Transcript_22896/g.52452 Transcript_22896/m.52452 type:complete len:212 (-) Transcript_22896:230-865(-)
MSVFRTLIAARLLVIFCDSAPCVSSQACLVLPHSVSSSSLLSSNFLRRSSSMSTTSFDRNLYVGSDGSSWKFCWSSALTDRCSGERIIPSVSARSILSATVLFTARKEPTEVFAFSNAVTALLSEVIAFCRSAAEISYSVCSFLHLTTEAWRSAARVSCSACLVVTSPAFFSLSAVFDCIVADKVSMESCSNMMLSAFVLVLSLQKHAKVS